MAGLAPLDPPVAEAGQVLRSRLGLSIGERDTAIASARPTDRAYI